MHNVTSEWSAALLWRAFQQYVSIPWPQSQQHHSMGSIKTMTITSIITTSTTTSPRLTQFSMHTFQNSIKPLVSIFCIVVNHTIWHEVTCSHICAILRHQFSSICKINIKHVEVLLLWAVEQQSHVASNTRVSGHLHIDWLGLWCYAVMVCVMVQCCVVCVMVQCCDAVPLWCCDAVMVVCNAATFISHIRISMAFFQQIPIENIDFVQYAAKFGTLLYEIQTIVFCAPLPKRLILMSFDCHDEKWFHKRTLFRVLCSSARVTYKANPYLIIQM